MTTTPAVLFTSVVQSAVASGAAWDNPANLVTGGSTFANTNGAFPQSTNLLRASSPDVVLPSRAVISQIAIVFDGSASGGVFPQYSCNCLIQGGATKTVTLVGTPGPEVLSGDLTYWGLTNEEALEFVNGTRYFQQQCVEEAGSDRVFIGALTVQFEYETLLTDVRSPPVVF